MECKITYENFEKLPYDTHMFFNTAIRIYSWLQTEKSKIVIDTIDFSNKRKTELSDNDLIALSIHLSFGAIYGNGIYYKNILHYLGLTENTDFFDKIISENEQQKIYFLFFPVINKMFNTFYDNIKCIPITDFTVDCFEDFICNDEGSTLGSDIAVIIRRDIIKRLSHENVVNVIFPDKTETETAIGNNDSHSKVIPIGHGKTLQKRKRKSE